MNAADEPAVVRVDIVVEGVHRIAPQYMTLTTASRSSAHPHHPERPCQPRLLHRAGRALIARVLAQPNIAPARTPAALADLTSREREILTLVASGLSNDQIAERLTISPATAKIDVNRTMMKLNARDRAQLVVIAYETGFITPGRKPD